MKLAPPDPGRRRLLGRTGSLGAAGVATAVLGPAASVPSATVQAASKPAAPGSYHETEHTRTYYRLARY
jgi:hypothetical protein